MHPTNVVAIWMYDHADYSDAVVCIATYIISWQIALLPRKLFYGSEPYCHA
jgi:hypothetical protein